MKAAEEVSASLQAYAAYKDSGVEWIGEIPAGWQALPIKKEYEVQLGKMLQPLPSPDATTEVAYLRAANVQTTGINTEDVNTMFMSAAEQRKYGLRAGDLLILEGGDIGRSAMVNAAHEDFKIQNSLHRVRAGTSQTAFLHYVMQHIKSTGILDVLCNKATIQHLTSGKLLNLVIPVPLVAEQITIAAFLDRETARIDELLREQGLLLEDLGLKRQATITQVVTQGIDSKVTLRSSGTPWIGDMPQHWGTRRLKQISPEQTVGVVVNPSTYVDPAGTVPFLVGSNIAEQRFKLQQLRFISEENNALLQKTRLRAGDLVTVRVGAPGITAVIPPELDGCNCASVMITRQSPIFDSRWLAYAMNSRIGRAQVEVVQYGAAQEQFNISHAVDFVFPFPPHAEQQAIADHLDAQLAQIDALTEEVRASMALMRQHRAALITAAVTGKIDVRDQVAP